MSLRVHSRGAATAYFNDKGLNVFRVDVCNTGDEPATVKLAVQSIEAGAIVIGTGESVVNPGRTESPPCRYVRVNFAERRDQEHLVLVEAEIWGTAME